MRTLAQAGVLAAVICVTAAPAFSQSIRLEETAAGQAFKAKQFDAALAEFQKLAAANPRDALVLRYLAITLDRLGRYDEAIQHFKQALSLTPENAALHYHLGATYYKAGATDLAEKSFRRVLQLAPESLYAQLAQRYMETLGQQRVQLQRSGEPAPFGFYLTLGVQQDSNIPAAPGTLSLYDGHRSGLRTFEYLSAEYRFLRSPGWLGSLEASTYQAQYPDDTFEEFRLSTYGAGGSLLRTTTVWDFPWTGSVKYEFNAAILDGDLFSRSHILTTGSQIGFTKNTSTHLFYRHTWDDFEEEGFDRQFSSRDGNTHAVGLAQVWYFADRKGQVRVGYEFQKGFADGWNFNLDAHKVSVSASVPLWWGIQADLGGEYIHEKYPDFRGPVPRETDRSTFTAGLSKWLGQHIRVDLNYAFTDEDSNYEILSYRRSVVGASVSYVY